MEGYAKLASQMSIDPQYAIYRKFGALNALNLLYYQAELVGLEADLQATAAEDRVSQDSEKRLFDANWFELSNAGPGKNMQYQQLLQLRQTLKEYSMYRSQLPLALMLLLKLLTMRNIQMSSSTGTDIKTRKTISIRSQNAQTLAQTFRPWQPIPIWP